MPSSTVWGAELTNLGSLVTTFTPAPSCTGVSNLAVAVQNPDTLVAAAYLDCDAPTVTGCVPHASNLLDLYSTANDKAGAHLPYYSPGLVCPSGWTTAGSIVGPSGWSSASGAYTQSHFPYPDRFPGGIPQRLNPLDQYVTALEESETLAWCCPSGFAAGPFGIACASSIMPLSSYTPYTGVCIAEPGTEYFATVSTYDGSVYSNGVITPAETGPITLSTRYDTEIFNPSNSEYVLATYARGVMLIHKEEDKTLGSSATGTATSMETSTATGGGNDDKDSDKGDGDGVGESIARSLRPTSDGLWAVLPVAVTAGTVFLTMVLL